MHNRPLFLDEEKVRLRINRLEKVIDQNTPVNEEKSQKDIVVTASTPSKPLLNITSLKNPSSVRLLIDLGLTCQ